MTSHLAFDLLFACMYALFFVSMGFRYFLYGVWHLYFEAISSMEYRETSQAGMRDIWKIIGKYFPWKSVFYDLGSGRWSLLFPLSKLVPKCRFVGVENIAFQIRFCRFLQYFQSKKTNLRFIRSDFSTVNISRADMLFLYVPRFLLPGLKKILQAKMNKGQILILYRISFKNWKPVEIVPTDFVNGISRNNIYIYQNT